MIQASINHSTGYPEEAHQASALELLQLDTYISFSSWSLDASSWSTCSCCWARLSSWDVLSRSLSSSWLVSFSLVFSTLVSSLPLRSSVHWCSNWGGKKRTESITTGWGILVLRLSIWVLELSWAGSYFYQSQKLNKTHTVLFRCSLYRHNCVTQEQSHSILWLNFIQFKNTPVQNIKKVLQRRLAALSWYSQLLF